MLFIRDRLPITKGIRREIHPQRCPSPATHRPWTVLFLGKNFAVRQPATRSFSTETPYKITFFVQAKFVSLPVAPVDYKERSSRPGPFVPWLRRFIRECHTPFPFVPNDYLPPLSPTYPTRFSLSFSPLPELIHDGCPRARLEIKNRVAQRILLDRSRTSNRIEFAERFFGTRFGNFKVTYVFLAMGSLFCQWRPNSGSISSYDSV